MERVSGPPPYETERLILRPMRPEDAPGIHRAIADEEIVRNLAKAPWPYLPEHAEAFAGRAFDPAEPVLLLIDKASGVPAGVIGLDRMPDGGLELGYWIARAFWGRGYATEAARFMIVYARDRIGERRLVSGHFIDNPASGRVLEKIGFVDTGEVERRHSVGRRGEASCRIFRMELGQAAGT